MSHGAPEGCPGRCVSTKAGGLVFPAKTSGERYDFKRIWKQIRKTVVPPEGFRLAISPTLWRPLRRKGVPLREIQRLSALKDSRATRGHRHPWPRVLQQAAAKAIPLIGRNHWNRCRKTIMLTMKRPHEIDGRLERLARKREETKGGLCGRNLAGTAR